MYRVLREITHQGYPPRVGGYGAGDECDQEALAPDEPGPLDPIDVAGCTQTRVLRKKMEDIGASALVEGMSIIDGRPGPLGDRVRKELQKLRGHDRAAPCQTKYADHFTELMRSRVIQASIGSKGVGFHSTYFAVVKEGPSPAHPRGTCRSIFNGKRMSSLMSPPPPVNIASTSEIVGRMIQHGQENDGRYFVLSGDLRHWFHQLSLPKDMQPYFSLRMNEQDYQWIQLPMGWSYSPFIAQCFAWSLLAAREKDEDMLIDEEAFKGTQLPTFVRVLKGGFMTVYYDNFLVVAREPQIICQIRTRIERICKLARTVIKPGSLIEISTRQMFIDKGLDFIGSHFQGVAAADQGKGQLSWRPAKLDPWCKKYGSEYRPATIRECAEWLGRILFAILLSGKPLGGDTISRQTRRALCLLGRLAYLKGWNARLTEENQDLLDLCQKVWSHVTKLAEDPYRHDHDNPATVRLPLDQIDWLVATDSSDEIGACMFFGRIGQQWGLEANFTETIPMYLNDHIYLKEMTAAVRGIESFFERNAKVERLFVVVDNSAVAWALEQGFTTHERGGAILHRIDRWLDRVVVVLVISEDNPADCPTRVKGRESLPGRIEKMTKAVSGHIAGARWASKKSQEWRPTDEGPEQPLLRHAPPPGGQKPTGLTKRHRTE